MAQHSLPAVVYSEQLRFLRYGEPMWRPEAKPTEVAIGDVGYVSDGRFFRLFNAVTGATNKRGQLPANFVKLEYAEAIEERDEEYMKPHKPQSSRSIGHVRVEAGIAA